ncbi:MAG TPA: DsbA family protein [Vicinamibacterales bacterium]|jgi:protein-disulfide isomerase|nr:DsbA family protein [Vicinamibacterales bacterium]
MRVLLAAILVAVGVSPAFAQQRGVFIGVDDDPTLGSADAKVLMIEFGDYQCPSCRMFWKDVEPRLKKEYIDTGKVKLVFRDYPIVQIHPEALLAAEAVDCAGEQNKYWEYHDKVFREQYNKGDDLVRFKAADLKKWAKDTRLDQAKFDQCLDSEKYKGEILKDKADGDAVSVQGTPTFFINGRVIGGAQPYPAFKTLIDDLLKQ